jgi:hypothetical protein
MAWADMARAIQRMTHGRCDDVAGVLTGHYLLTWLNQCLTLGSLWESGKVPCGSAMSAMWNPFIGQFCVLKKLWVQWESNP